MFCPQCGKELPEGARFCGNCGSPIGERMQSPNTGNLPGGNLQPRDMGRGETGRGRKRKGILSAYVQNWKGLGAMERGKRAAWLGGHGAAALVLLMILAFVILREPASGPVVVAWEDAGLEDRVMSWGDTELEKVMRKITGIQDRDIMLSDVWELTELDLTRDTSDISALGSLTNLQDLNLSGTQVSDISALGSLTNLKKLDLILTDISDISALGNLTNLEELRLDTCADISILGSLTNLKKLELSDPRVSDISALGSLLNLQDLDLRFTDVSDISALESLTNLEKLNLYDTQVSDISALGNLRNLNILNLSGTQVDREDVRELEDKLGININF